MHRPSTISSRTAAQRRRRLLILATGALAAMVALVAAGTAGATTVTYPADSGFASGQGAWTDNDSCSALCTVSTTYASGSPSGTATVSYSSTLGVLGQDAGTAELASPSFSWSGGQPADASLAIGRDATISQPLSIGGSVSWTVSLANQTTGTGTVLESGPLSSDGGFVAVDPSVAPALLVDGDSYRIEVTLSFSSSVTIDGGATVAFDQIALTADETDAGSSGSGGSGGGDTGGGGSPGGSGSVGSGSGAPTAGSSGGSTTPVSDTSTVPSQSSGASSPSSTGAAGGACALHATGVSRLTLNTCLAGSVLHVLVSFPWSARRVVIGAGLDAALLRSDRGKRIGSIVTGSRPHRTYAISVRRGGVLGIVRRAGILVAASNGALVVTRLGARARYLLVTIDLGDAPSHALRVTAKAWRAPRRAPARVARRRGPIVAASA